MTDRPPIEIVRTETIHTSSRFTVVRDVQELADGARHDWESVIFRDTVHAVPIDGERHVYLVRQYRAQLRRETLEIVGGGVDDGHTPEQAIHRELLEEAGITARLVPLGEARLGVSTVRCRVHVYLAMVEAIGERDLEPFEQLTMRGVERMPLEQAVNLVMDGSIVDVNSRMAILLAAEHLRRHGLAGPVAE